MYEKKITIITVTYNCVNTIQRTIDSVISQGYSNLEYIIVDGQSKDGTLEIIEKNEKENPGIIKHVSEKDKGLYDAMNKGLKLATGDIIGIINGDDYYAVGTLKKVNEIFNAEPETEIVYSDLLYSKNNVVDVKNPLAADHLRLTQRMSVNHPTCFVKNSVYHHYGTFDIEFRIAADYEIMARFYSNNCKFVKSNQVLAIMEAGGLSSNNRKSIGEKYRIHRRYFSKYSAELLRIKNIALYYYRKLKKKRYGK